MLDALVALPSPFQWSEEAVISTGTTGKSGGGSRSQGGHVVFPVSHVLTTEVAANVQRASRSITGENQVNGTAGQLAASFDLNLHTTPHILPNPRPSTQVD